MGHEGDGARLLPRLSEGHHYVRKYQGHATSLTLQWYSFHALLLRFLSVTGFGVADMTNVGFKKTLRNRGRRKGGKKEKKKKRNEQTN